MNQSLGEDADAEPSRESEIPNPGSATRDAGTWKPIGHNRRVLAGWNLLCRQIPENAIRCYDWLREHPTKAIRGRCYELKYKQYAGVWCFEIGSGQRVYYKLRQNSREVLVYYAGPHPWKVPCAPAE